MPSDAERALIASAVKAANGAQFANQRRAREQAMLHLLLHSPLNSFQCLVVLSFLPFLRTKRLRVGDRSLFELGTIFGTTNAELLVMLAAVR